MRQVLATLAALFLVVSSSAQEVKVDTIYYDYNWKVVSSKYVADFYRVKVEDVARNSKLYRDYYITGELRGRGGYLAIDTLSDENTVFDGECTSFFKNGDTERKCTYVGGQPSGEFFEYSRDRLIIRHAYFREGKLNGTHTEFDQDNNCVQIEYTDNIPADYYTVSNMQGTSMTYNTSDNKPRWISPQLSELQTEYRDGVRWSYYVKNGLTVCMALSTVKDYGKYYRVDLVVENNSFEPIEFNPEINVTAFAYNSYGTVDRAKVLSCEEYMAIVKRRQALNAVLVGLAENLVASTAGHSYSMVHTSGFSFGSTYNRWGLNTGSYTSFSHSSSVVANYDASAAYQARMIACQRVADFVGNQLSERAAKKQEYLKRTTLNPSEYVAGYINVARDDEHQAVKVVVGVNGAEYSFGNIEAIDMKLSDLNNDNYEEFNSRMAVNLRKEYAASQIEYKAKYDRCEITKVELYPQCTKVTFRYTNSFKKENLCAVNPQMYLRYSYEGEWKTSRMIKAIGVPFYPAVHKFSEEGEQTEFCLYFPAIDSEITRFDIVSRGNSKLEWINIRLKD